MAHPISDGTYQLSQPNGSYLCLFTNEDGSPLKIQDPIIPGEQEASQWQLEIKGNTVTLKNLEHGLFAGIHGNPQPGVPWPIVGVPGPFGWELRHAGGFQYFLYIDSSEGPAYLSYAPASEAPKAALSSHPGEPWSFERTSLPT